MTASRIATDNVVPFMLAGDATLTLVSKKTQARFTYRVRVPEESRSPIWFVSVLTGGNNETDFRYIGQLRNSGNGLRFEFGRKSKIEADAPSVLAFSWFVKKLIVGVPEEVEVWHEGKCGRCGRKLTVPSSIESGFGPICSGQFLAEAA